MFGQSLYSLTDKESKTLSGNIARDKPWLCHFASLGPGMQFDITSSGFTRLGQNNVSHKGSDLDYY
ncbi:MAG: hypothetical protein C9356_01135 [Oleiphilus sp.]|nr:MAG: hypothetical protein C9356_01135 [Oleiphilus sp.]